MNFLGNNKVSLVIASLITITGFISDFGHATKMGFKGIATLILIALLTFLVALIGGAIEKGKKIYIA